MGKKKKKRRNFCNRPNSRPAKWREWEKQTTGPRFAPRGRWFSLCVFGVTHCDIVTGNREVLQQKPIYVSQLHPNDPHKIIRLTAGRSEFSRLTSMCSHPIDTGGINAAFYVTQHMNSLSADSVWFGPRDQNKKAKKKSVRNNENWHEKKGRSEWFHLKWEHRSASRFDTVPAALRAKSVLLMWRDNCFANGDRAMRFACFR